MGINDKVIFNNNDNNDNKNNKQIDIQKLLQNKKAMVGVGIVGAVAGLLVFKAIFSGHSTSVRVEQGLSQKDINELVSQTLKPVVQNQEQIENQLKQLTQEQQQQKQQQQQNQKQQQQTQQNTKTTQTQQNSNKQQTAKTTKHQSAKPPAVAQLPSLPPPAPAYPNPLASPIPAPAGQIQPIGSTPLMHFKEMKSEKMNGFNPQYAATTEKKSPKTHGVYIPAGSIAEGELLYGFTAPESGVYPPVVIKITKPVWTANNWYEPFQECLIVTKAQFNISEDLAQLGGQGSTLSCVLPNGKVIEKSVDVAVGENATDKGLVTIGLTGKEEYLTGKELATIMSLASLQGFAQGLQNIQEQQTATSFGTVMTSIKNNALYSIAGGVNTGLNQFINFWLQQYQGKVPAIKVEPKKVFVMFVSGVDTGIPANQVF